MNIQQAKAVFMAQHLGQQVDISATEYYQIDKHRLTDIKLQGLRLDPEPVLFIKTNLLAHNDGNIWLNPDVCVLLLRDVSAISDMEAKILAGMIIGEPMNRYRNVLVTRDFAITGFQYIAVHHKNVRYRLNIDCTHVNFSVYDMEEDLSSQIDMKPFACIDYLRSIGVLLPFTYLNDKNKPVTLSTDEIIKLGWAKIVTP